MEWHIIKDVYRVRNQPVDRIVFGEEMSSQLSKEVEFKPMGDVTGTIGFLDYQIDEMPVPEKNSKFLKLTEEDFILKKTFKVLLAVIEPDFICTVSFFSIVDRAYLIAKDDQCECLVLDPLENEEILRWAKNNHFQPFFKHAIKYLR